jgi:hypothetical protein
MAQIFNNAVMTEDGKTLLSREMSGECMIQITRMAIGSGIYTAAEKTPDALQKMTALKNAKQSVSLSSLKRQDNKTILVTGVFTNDSLDVSYNINEIGLYAQEKGVNGTEILYSVAVVSEDEGEVMPASEGKNPVRIIQDWIVTVSNSADVTIQSLLDGAFAMAADVGNVDELTTKDSENLVKAVNEVLHRLIITDSEGVLGKKAAEVEAQELIDKIADKVMNDLQSKTGESADNTVSFDSADCNTVDAKSWADVDTMKTKEKQKSLFGKISTMFKNIRYLYNMLGTTDISQLGGTVTNAIKVLNDNKSTVACTQSLKAGTKVGTITIDKKDYDLYCQTNTDTKNTAGSTDTASKLFLVGATSQTASSQTYSQDTAYVGTDGCIYSNNKKTITTGEISRSSAITTQGAYALDAVQANASIEGTLANQLSQINSNLGTVKSNFGDIGINGHHVYLLAINHVAILQVGFWGVSTSQNETIGNVPSGYAPKFNVWNANVYENQQGYIKVNENGEIIYMSDKGGTSYFQATIAYIY